MNKNFLRSQVNGIVAFCMVGSFAFGAMLVLWQTAFGENPVANAMARYVTVENGGPQ